MHTYSTLPSDLDLDLDSPLPTIYSLLLHFEYVGWILQAALDKERKRSRTLKRPETNSDSVCARSPLKARALGKAAETDERNGDERIRSQNGLNSLTQYVEVNANEPGDSSSS